MRKSLVVAILVTGFLTYSCKDDPVNAPAPLNVTGIIADIANAPLELAYYTPTAGAAKRATSNSFFARINYGSIYGNDGCFDYVHGYVITGDSIRITRTAIMENGCSDPPYPNASHLEGTWRVTTSSGRIIFTGTRGRFEFNTEYGAPVKELPLMGKHWLAAGSNDTLFAQLLEAAAPPKMWASPNRWITLTWENRCPGSEENYDIFNAAFGVNTDSGIVMKTAPHDGCPYGTSASDPEVWSFVTAFFGSSVYAMTDSGAVFRNPQRHTYYRFTLAP